MMNPAAPVTPTSKSLPPLATIMVNPAVPLREPWRIAAAMTDFALRQTLLQL